MPGRTGRSRLSTPLIYPAGAITPPEDPPPGYNFPTTAFVYPLLPDDGGNEFNDGMINVLDYGAVGNGIADDTNAIQQAIFDNRETLGHPWSDKTLFFPGTPASPKTYKLTGLSGNTRGIMERRDAAGFIGGFRIQGETEAGAVLRLADNLPEFQDPTDPRYVIFQSNYANLDAGGGPHQDSDGTGLEGYNNRISDITIDLGSGNPGAAGINISMHNLGCIRRVTVQDAVGAGRSTNPAHRAFVGFDERRFGSGPNLLQRLTVKGCQYGFLLAQSMTGQGIEHLKLENQGTIGVVCDANGLFIRGLVSNNTVPVAEIQTGTVQNHFGESAALMAQGAFEHAITQVYDHTHGYLLIVDAVLTGTGAASTVSAIRNQTAGGQMFLRNIVTTGYARAAEENSFNITGANITEYATNKYNLWSQTPESLNITIVNTPDPGYSTLSNWTPCTAAAPGFPNGVQISHAGGTLFSNSWAALEAVINNCPTDTLYFPSTRNGRARFSGSGTVHITNPNLKRIVGHGIFFYSTGLNQTVTYHFDQTTRPVGFEQIIIEGFRLNSTGSGIASSTILLDTPRDVVLMDLDCTDINNTATNSGTLFLEDVIGGFPEFAFPQDTFARQHDADGGAIIKQYSGGDYWCLYYKSEPKSDAANTHLPPSWEGRIEFLGVHQTPILGGATANSPVWEVNNPTASIDAELSVAGYASSSGGTGGSLSIYAEEIQNGVTRQLLPGGTGFHAPLKVRGTKHHIALYRSKM